MGQGDIAQGVPISQQGYPAYGSDQQQNYTDRYPGSSAPSSQGYPGQQGYPQQGYPQQGYPGQHGYPSNPYVPPPAGYPGAYPQYPQYGGYPQQQPVYAQQQPYGSNADGCLEGCLAAMCCCFALELCFMF